MKLSLLFPLVASVALGVSFSFVPAGRAADPDFSLIEKLPARETAAKKTAHEGWDSGVTGKMLAATSAYNDTLTAIVTDLATAYYGKVKITKEEVTAYVKTLKSAAEFRHKLDNPTNEDRGSLDALEAPSVVSSDLEDTVEQMVESVVGDNEKFDYPAWEKRWSEAKKTGDSEPEPATPASPAAETKPVIPESKTTAPEAKSTAKPEKAE